MKTDVETWLDTDEAKFLGAVHARTQPIND